MPKAKVIFRFAAKWEELGDNSLRLLTNKEFEASLNAWRKQSTPGVYNPLAANETIRYLNEAERRWKPRL